MKKYLGIPGLISIFALVVVALSEAPFGRSDHSDNFYFARLYMDLFLEDGAWWEWHLTPAPNFFPEMLLYFLLASLGLSFGQLSLIYPFVALLLTAGLIFFTVREMKIDSQSALLITITFCASLIIAGEELSLWSRPAYHYGLVINLFLVFVLARRIFVGDWRWPKLILLLMVCSLGTASDFLFIPIAFSAVTGSAIVLFLCRRITLDRSAVMVTTTFAGIAAGVVIYFLITPNVANPVWASGLSLRSVFTHIGPHLSALSFILEHLLAHPYILAAIFACLFLGYKSLQSGTEENQSMLALCGFCLFGILANLYVFGLGAQPGGLYRYTVFATNIALFMDSVFIAQVIYALRQSFTPVYPLTFILITVCTIAVRFLPPAPDNTERAYLNFQNSVACLERAVDSFSSKNGAADFALANKITVASGGQLLLCPIRGNQLGYLPWNSSRNFCSKNVSFLIVRNQVETPQEDSTQFAYSLTTTRALDIAGPPVSIHNCDTLSVFFYGKNRLTID